jgi:hypothetical protein
MQVYRIGSVGVIDKANDGLSSSLHHEGRAWNTAIVSNKASLCAWVDFDVNRLDLNLVVVNGVITPAQNQWPYLMRQVCFSYRNGTATGGIKTGLLKKSLYSGLSHCPLTTKIHCRTKTRTADVDMMLYAI